MERRTAVVVWGMLALVVVGAGLSSLAVGALKEGLTARQPVGRWTAYIAPESACPGGMDYSRPRAAQEQTMVCLVNWARARAGLPAPAETRVLEDSARLKALDIASCEDFSHAACGREPSAVFDQVAYGGGFAERSIGENLAWGSALASSPVHILNGWLNSREHRELIFRRDWTEQGIAMLPAPGFKGYSAAELWVLHFGVRR